MEEENKLKPCNEPHFVGEENTLFYINCGIDVSQATSAEVFIQRPDNTTFKRTALPTTYNGSTDYVYFRIQPTDFTVCGKYKGQIFVVLGAWSGWGEPFHIKVESPVSSSSSSSKSSSSSSSRSSSSSSSSSSKSSSSSSSCSSSSSSRSSSSSSSRSSSSSSSSSSCRSSSSSCSSSSSSRSSSSSSSCSSSSSSCRSSSSSSSSSAT